MRQERQPIPNQFTMEPVVHVSIEMPDGTNEYRILTYREFKEWQDAGGDWDWFEEEEE